VIENLKGDLSKINRQLVRMNDLEDDYNTLQFEFKEVKKENIQLKKDLEVLEEQNQELAEELDKLSKRLEAQNEREGLYEGLRNDFKNLQRAFTDSQDEIQQL
jgi:chromosome segregation ATPase